MRSMTSVKLPTIVAATTAMVDIIQYTLLYLAENKFQLNARMDTHVSVPTIYHTTFIHTIYL